MCDTIRGIGSDAGRPEASFGTKNSGSETLRKIGKTIRLSSNDTLGHEVQKQFGMGNRDLEDAMLQIVDSMTPTERADMMDVVDYKGVVFADALNELEGLGRSYCVFPELEHVIQALEGEEGEEDETEEETEEDEEDDEETEEEEQQEFDADGIGYDAGGNMVFRDEAEFRWMDSFDENGCPKEVGGGRRRWR